MHPTTIKTLELLRKRKSRGITFDDFTTGFRLGARIYDLRQLGYEIVTKKIEICGGRKIAKYFLIKEKTND